jgi:hypothetical protein
MVAFTQVQHQREGRRQKYDILSASSRISANTMWSLGACCQLTVSRNWCLCARRGYCGGRRDFWRRDVFGTLLNQIGNDRFLPIANGHYGAVYEYVPLEQVSGFLGVLN